MLHLFRTDKVVTVQSDPGGSGVGNFYRLGWKEECIDDADDDCEVNCTHQGSQIMNTSSSYSSAQRSFGAIIPRDCSGPYCGLVFLPSLLYN